jgi:anthranilate synthase component 2
MTQRVLIIDNYDSFTFNLFQGLGALMGHEPIVVRNDAIDLAGIRSVAPTHIVISPGPGSPERERDFGVSAAAIDHLAGETPILGVCLGHQGIVHRLGGRVLRAPEIVHGKTWRIRHFGGRLFRGLDPELEVMRYHSLIGERSTLPASLRVTAETCEAGLLMGVEHVDLPLFGIQFHPESIGTPSGQKILQNFLEVSA